MPSWTKEQLEAINLENSNIIVSAGAGSGKTAVLTERVLRKLKNGVDVNELLILTFTKAAANEMKERIRNSIKKVPELKEQLDKIDSSYITTFDSYALSIVKKYHYVLNISPKVKIANENIILEKKEEYINNIFEELYKTKNKEFLKLINDFCLKDDDEIRTSILSISNKLDLKFDKEEYLNNYINNYYNEKIVEENFSKYHSLISDKINLINLNIKKLEDYVPNDYINTLKDNLNDLLESTTYEEIDANIKLPMIPRGTDEEGKEIKENISKILKEITSLTQFSKEQLINNYFSTKDYASIIIKIILKLDKLMNEYKYENDCYEFTDIAKMAIKILKENPNIKDEIKYSFNEILLDEYQDTSDLQEAFINMIENNNVYMVGDIKQSIYRFRNANPYIFKNKYDSYSNDIGGKKIDLNKNFRSRFEVLDDINVIFNLVMDDLIGGADYKATHQMIYGNYTYENEGKTNQNNNLEIYEYSYDLKSPYTKEELEIFIIANDIKEKIDNHYQVFDKNKLILRDITYDDFVILMDRTTNFDLYKKIFEYMKIPLTIHKDENINNGEDINIIKNILKLIIKRKNNIYDEEFKYAFMSIARSYLFRYSDQEIFKCIKDNNYNNNIMQIINDIINKLDILNNSQLLLTIIDKFDFYNKLITIGNIENGIIRLEYLTNLGLDLENSGYDINAFISFIDNIALKNRAIKFSLNKETGNSVKIMTIHKSKGLEYHICYFSGLYAKFNISDLKDKFMYDNNYGLILPINDNGIGDIFYKELVKDNYIKEEISEKIRLFYVALTRAKEKMIMVRPITPDKYYEKNKNGVIINEKRYKYMSFDDIIKSIRSDLDKYSKSIDIEKIQISKDYNLSKKEDFSILIDKDDNKIEVNEININTEQIESKKFSKTVNKIFTKEEYKNIELGKNIHKLLEYINFNDINNSLENIDNKFYKDIVYKFLNSDLFNDEIINYYQEYEFMYMENDMYYHGIIDFIIETNDEIKIIDYKLQNIVDDNYIKQLKGYKNYLNKVSNKEINIYLYSLINHTYKKID